MDYSKETLCRIYGITNMTDEDFSKILKEVIKDPESYQRKVLKLCLGKEQIDKHACNVCKGKCCQTAPCHLSPIDIPNITFWGLIKEIGKGYLSIVQTHHHNSGKTVYILRIRGLGRPISDIASMFEIECSLLGKNGCLLSYEQRPLGAKMLIPSLETRCINVYDLNLCQKDWMPYQKLLKLLYKFYKITG